VKLGRGEEDDDVNEEADTNLRVWELTLWLLLVCQSPPESTSLRWALRWQDATTMRIKGSEWRVLRTAQAGQPYVLHQSRSSAMKHCSQEKAPRAAPRKASSRSTMERGEVGRRRYRVCDLWWIV
jgi:hypothetical protein